ncbi:Uncharacterised protein g1245 [Pycnogonum litorale]
MVPTTKRKHNVLTIKAKVEILRKLEKGACAKSLAEQYGTGIRKIYDIKSAKEKILKFYSENGRKAFQEKQYIMDSLPTWIKICMNGSSSEDLK